MVYMYAASLFSALRWVLCDFIMRPTSRPLMTNGRHISFIVFSLLCRCQARQIPQSPSQYNTKYYFSELFVWNWVTSDSHKIMIHYHVLDCEPLWFERYNMKGANGVLLRDRFGLDSCKSACVNNRACTSLHVYLNPRKGPSECWLNYESRGSSDPSSLLQSIRYLHLVLVDRCGASSQNASQGIVNRYMERW